MNDDEIRRTIEFYEGCEPRIETVATNIITYANGERDYEYDEICVNCTECDDKDCEHWGKYNEDD